MTKQETETKEWTNIDFTKTSAYLTVKVFQKEAITWIVGESPEGIQGGIPEAEFTILKRLRRLDSIIQPDKGPITKEITSMFRQIVRQPDSKQNGRFVPKEFLVINGYFKGYDFAGEQVGQEFWEGVNQAPVMAKIYTMGAKRFDPETGQDLGKIGVQKVVKQYNIELPKDAAKRKKIIDNIIDYANGTYPENINYYYKDVQAGGTRNNTFSYEQFTNCSIESLHDLHKKGGGAKGGGYYRDKDNRLRDSNDNLV
jgi:hypothetical protein